MGLLLSRYAATLLGSIFILRLLHKTPLMQKFKKNLTSSPSLSIPSMTFLVLSAYTSPTQKIFKVLHRLPDLALLLRF